MKIKLYTVILSLFPLSVALGQTNVGIKTNLLYGGYTYTPNLGVEIELGHRTTLELSGGYNPWNLDSKGGMKKLVHFLVQPEFRYFFGSSFKGHFLGIHGLYSKYNIGGHELPLLFGKGSQAFRHEGFAYGGGIAYGYQLPFGRHWNLELSLGAGMMQMNYDKFDCVNCGKMVSSRKKTYFGPTKAAISIVYILKGRERKTTNEKIPVLNPAILPIEKPDSISTTQSILISATSPTAVTKSEKILALRVPTPCVSTADSLAIHFSFLAPASEFGHGGKSKEAKLFNLDMPLNINAEGHSSSQNPDERFIAENEKGAILIHFSRSATIIDRYYQENNTSLVTLASVLKMIQASDDSRVSKIVVAGFASPEGLLTENDRLARQRAFAVRNFILANSTVHADSILLYNGSEDWRGLRKLVAASDMEAKNEIIRIIDNVPIKAGREKRLMDLDRGDPYRWMALHFFPKLRNAAYIKVYYTDK